MSTEKPMTFETLRDLVIAYLRAHDEDMAFQARIWGTDDPDAEDVFVTPRMEKSGRLHRAVDDTCEALRTALAPTGPITTSDQVRPTATARKFLAEGAIRDPSRVTAVTDDGERVWLDPPTPDFAPGGGVPTAWLERVFP